MTTQESWVWRILIMLQPGSLDLFLWVRLKQAFLKEGIDEALDM